VHVLVDVLVLVNVLVLDALVPRLHLPCPDREGGTP
jgi:hypothetical protein